MKKLLLILCMVLACASCARQKSLVLENEYIIAVFDANGSLTRLENKQTGWKVAGRESLGQSFEILLPLPERRLHLVKGSEQSRPAADVYPDSIVFTWKQLKSPHASGKLDITFTGMVALDGNGLKYTGRIANNSDYTVEYIAWPYLGEVSVPDKGKDFVSQTRNGSKNLFPAFNGEHGYWGVEYPTQTEILPEGSFLLARNGEQGMYIGSQQFFPGQMVICSFELIPGYDLNNRNPETDEMDGQQVRIQFKVNHVVYASPKSTAGLFPLSLKLYKGDWQKGADIYKEWKQAGKLQTQPASPEWVKQPATWQKINISGGQDLINYAREAKKEGVGVLEVSGWKKNGATQFVELVDGLPAAIAECKKMGVRVVLAMNFTAADPRSAWYNEVLKSFTVIDPFGIVYDRSILCPFANGLQQSLQQEYAKIPEVLKTDGMICDDNNHRGKTFFCFHPGHGHPVPAFIDPGNLKLDERFTKVVKQQNPDFVSMGYGFYDAQTAFQDGYHIQPGASAPAVHRYLNPQAPVVSSVDVRSARKDMNTCLKNRYNICYDLRFYSNRLGDYPQVMAYGRQIETLRNKYRDFIWNGVFSDVLGASVTGNNVAYAVYTRPSDGKKAVVVVNQSETESTTAKIAIEGASQTLTVATPEKPEAVACNGSIELLPQSAAIIMVND